MGPTAEHETRNRRRATPIEIRIARNIGASASHQSPHLDLTEFENEDPADEEENSLGAVETAPSIPQPPTFNEPPQDYMDEYGRSILSVDPYEWTEQSAGSNGPPQYVSRGSSNKLLVVVSCVLVVLAVGSIMLAAISARNGSQWKTKAESLAADLEESEKDVASLESRVNDIVTSKNQLEDELGVVGQENVLLGELTRLANAAAEKAGACVEQTNQFLDSVSGREDRSTLDSRADSADSACVAAEQAYRDLQAKVDVLTTE